MHLLVNFAVDRKIEESPELEFLKARLTSYWASGYMVSPILHTHSKSPFPHTA